VRASTYLAQAATKKYLEPRAFADARIELKFFRPPSPVYPQLWGDFIPDLSAFDSFSIVALKATRSCVDQMTDQAKTRYTNDKTPFSKEMG